MRLARDGRDRQCSGDHTVLTNRWRVEDSVHSEFFKLNKSGIE